MSDVVLIYRLGSLGDTVALLPVFSTIARRYPNARRVALTNKPVAGNAAPLLSVLGRHALVHDALEYPIRQRNPAALARLWVQLRALAPTRVIHLMPSRGNLALRRDEAFFRACGIKERIGFAASQSTRQLRFDASRGEYERELERAIRCLEPELGPIPLSDPADWDLSLTQQEIAVATAARQQVGEQPLVAINMGGKAADEKDWGEDNWVELVQRLFQVNPGVALAIVGAQADRDRASRVAAAYGGTSLNLCGKLSPRETAALMRCCCLFIGHDSGPLHLAAAVQIPTLGLFGSYNQPRQWHPPGPHVHIIHSVSGVTDIAVSEVAALAVKLLRMHK